MDEFLEQLKSELNEEQYQAVVYTGGPSLVVAGAGSGKTRVLIYKIAYLLRLGVKPWTIMALTFTNKAARQMKERIAAVVGAELAAGLWMGTFHSVFCRILRAEASVLNFPSRFTIYDQSDAINMLKAVIKEMGLSDKTYKPNKIAALISSAKNRLLLPNDYLNNPEILQLNQARNIPQTGNIYERYMQRCRQAAVMDFDDLLLYTHLLFLNHPDICARYASRFNFLLVDEYQDTNFAQACIVRQLTAEKQNLCVVGDDAQSIYSFRGACIDNMLGFNSQFAAARTFKLQRNYRSTQNIVAAANSVIRHNQNQIRKDVYSRREKGDKLSLYAAYTDTDEAEIVTNQIAAMRRANQLELDAFAVLYRTNAQSRPLEESLRKHAIPYQIYGGLSFYQRKEVKDVIAYCRLAVNPHDEEAFKRALNNPPRGIGQTTLGKLITAAAEHNTSLWETTLKARDFSIPLNNAALLRLQTFALLISDFAEKANSWQADKLMLHIVQETGLLRLLKQDDSPEGLSRQQNVQELLNAVQDFTTRHAEGESSNVLLYDFLQEIALLTTTDETDTAETPRVNLMTIHSAKGLEFPVVFIVGMEDNIFPGHTSIDSPRALEEERRLFYVALTRAERKCILTYARSRRLYGQMEFSTPSRFLRDIDPQYIELGGMKREPVSPPPAPPKLTLRPVAKISGPSKKKQTASFGGITLHVGDKVEHERFGLGLVTNLEGEAENLKAEVEFQSGGTKKLLLRFARLKVVR